MKDRWKIFWISVFLSIILAALFLFLGFSFRKVDLQNYGILRYDYYDTVNLNQQPRVSGNYLVGLDHSFIEFPKGLITHEFSIKTLTKDKSMIQIQGIHISKLIYSELLSLYFTYGNNYRSFLFASVEELFHEAIEEFSLNEIISDRAKVESYLKSYVKTNIQAQYQWIQTRFIALGAVKTDLLTRTLSPEIQIQQNYLEVVNRAQFNQRKFNIYSSGGFELLSSIQKLHGELFFNITQKLKFITDKLAGNTTQIIPAMEYVIGSQSLPLLNTKIQIQISRE